MKSCRSQSSLVLLALIAVCSGVLWAQTIAYEVIPINSVFDPPGTVLIGDVNNHRAVAATDQLNGRPRMAFVWRPGKSTPLPTLGGTCSSGLGINDAGHVVGSSCIAGDSTFHAFLYRNHQMEDLDTFGGIRSFASLVNGSNQVTGRFTTSDGLDHGFFWEKKKWRDLGSLGGSSLFIFGLNETGVVTGQADISNDPDPIFGIPPFHGFVWSDGVLSDLGHVFGGNFNFATKADSLGRVVGGADLAGDASGHAFILDHGTVTDLSPFDFVSAWANDMNNQGDIVGSWGFKDDDPADGPPCETIVCPCEGVIWHDGQVTFLNDVIDPHWQVLVVTEINDKGDITGLGQKDGGHFQKVLLKKIVTPVAQQAGWAPLAGRASASPRGIQRGRDGSIRILP